MKTFFFTFLIILFTSNIYSQNTLKEELLKIKSNPSDLIVIKDKDKILKVSRESIDEKIVSYFYNDKSIDLRDYPLCKNLFMGIFVSNYDKLEKTYFENVSTSLINYMNKSLQPNDSLTTDIERTFLLNNNFLEENIEKNTRISGILFFKKTNITKDTLKYTITKDFIPILLYIKTDNILKKISKINNTNDSLELINSFNKEKINKLELNNDSLKRNLSTYNNLIESFIKNPNDSIKALSNYCEKVKSTYEKNILKLKQDSINLTKKIDKLKQISKNLKNENYKQQILIDTLKKKNLLCEDENKRLDSLLKIADPDFRILNQIYFLNSKIDSLIKNKSYYPYYEKNYKKELLDTIIYANNIYKLDDVKLKKLKKIVDTLKVIDYKEIIIVGYADKIGNSDYNLLLSELRAKTVQAFLFESGININKIKAFGIGELGNDKNRKVEIYIEK